MLKKLYITLLAAAIFCCAQTAWADQITMPAGTYYFDFTEIVGTVTQFQLFNNATSEGKQVNYDGTRNESVNFQTSDVTFDSSEPLNTGVTQLTWDNYQKNTGLTYLVLTLEHGIYIPQQNCMQYQTDNSSWHGWWQYPASVTDLGTHQYYCKLTSTGPVWQTSGALPSTTPRVYFFAGDHGSVGTHTAGGDNIITGAAVEEGTAVNLVATPETGYAFFGWRDANGSIVSTAANYVFSMPSTNVSLTAVFYTESTDPVIEDCDGCFLIRE